ncbi:jg5500 [Pararge aegeria aegeria]|uniref:Jg5500 protein n=1 Tax=Pararge aegeria aegeria TaxID=348720 RepID=A0A8S4SHK9_9NEOP|nr:jg5500 [Pararge aegeria aegeria]
MPGKFGNISELSLSGAGFGNGYLSTLLGIMWPSILIAVPYQSAQRGDYGQNFPLGRKAFSPVAPMDVMDVPSNRQAFCYDRVQK